MEVDERYLWQAFSHKFGGFCRCRRRSGYVGPQKLKVLFQGVCYALGVLNQKKISNPQRSSSDPLASGGLQSLEEDIDSYSIGRRWSASTSLIAYRQSVISRWRRIRQLRLRR